MEGDRRTPAAAFFLSVVPGLGHLYAGRVGSAILWLPVVLFAYAANEGLGLFLHFICAATAARAAEASNRAEREETRTRKESAADVARMLDRAVARTGGAGPEPEVAADPPPRIMRAAFPLPPEDLVAALKDAMGTAGLLVLGVDGRRLRVRGSADLGNGQYTTAVAQVEPTPSGSRVRLLVDRPPGSPMDPERDDAILRDLLLRTERLLGAGTAAGAFDPSRAAPARGSAIIGDGELLTEDHFLDSLREAWESYEQGWLPEREWVERKESLVSGVVLRPDTRATDFFTACRPLMEAGVLDAADLRALEGRLRRP